jgi:hypothetical protein
MCVRNENLLQAMNLPRWQCRNIAEIEQDRTPFEQRFDIERRVSGAAIDQVRVQEWAHNVEFLAPPARQDLRHVIFGAADERRGVPAMPVPDRLPRL